jgi:hypothetical protein
MDRIIKALSREDKKLEILQTKIELRRGQIKNAMEALSGKSGNGRKRRKKMSASSRKKLSLARKKYWAERKKREKEAKKD